MQRVSKNSTLLSGTVKLRIGPKTLKHGVPGKQSKYDIAPQALYHL